MPVTKKEPPRQSNPTRRLQGNESSIPPVKVGQVVEYYRAGHGTYRPTAAIVVEIKGMGCLDLQILATRQSREDVMFMPLIENLHANHYRRRNGGWNLCERPVYREDWEGQKKS